VFRTSLSDAFFAWRCCLSRYGERAELEVPLDEMFDDLGLEDNATPEAAKVELTDADMDL
jgi:hypothetical protein